MAARRSSSGVGILIVRVLGLALLGAVIKLLIILLPVILILGSLSLAAYIGYSFVRPAVKAYQDRSKRLMAKPAPPSPLGYIPRWGPARRYQEAQAHQAWDRDYELLMRAVSLPALPKPRPKAGRGGSDHHPR